MTAIRPWPDGVRIALKSYLRTYRKTSEISPIHKMRTTTRPT